jgi:uncharacterized protein (TIGR02599 family)
MRSSFPNACSAKPKTGNFRCGAFTLVELLVSMAVLGLMVVMMLSVTSSTQSVWRESSSRVEQYREARRAFERINQRLSQAILNPYADYVNASGEPRTIANAATFQPRRYARQSELRYLQTNAAGFPAPRGGDLVGQAVFFQAPLGRTDQTGLQSMNALVNTIGFFVERGTDTGLRPAFLTGEKNRYRLFELVEPTESLTIYSFTSGNASYSGTDWITTPLSSPTYSSRLADNIVALLFRAEYRDGNTTRQSYEYSSAPVSGATQPPEVHALPPSVRVTMLSLDEVSARRVSDENLTLVNAIDDATLAQLETQLTDKRLNFRKFESVVSIGAAKWSTP